ncbi:unnamed protein product [Meloidogyne enterolobii]|uniref:Uncharacterized protein n=1 Tax=Meloidogyne enterolobii TaxID=390850 RepID=A0ACB0Z891_MELEN
MSSKILKVGLMLSNKQQSIKDSVTMFAQQVLPIKSVFPLDFIKKAQSVGLLNTTIPTQFGGQGLNVCDHTFLSETIGYECSSVGTAILGNDLAATPLIIAGNDDLKKKYLGMLVEEPLLSAYCLPEYDGNDSRPKIEAVKKRNEWVLNGADVWVTNGAAASLFIVIARTDFNPEARIDKSFTAFVVDGNSKGLFRGEKKGTFGQQCMNARTITFRDVVVPSTNIIGSIGDGMKIAKMTFDKTGPVKSAFAIGLAYRALDEIADYSLEGKAWTDPNVFFLTLSSYLFSEAC